MLGLRAIGRQRSVPFTSVRHATIGVVGAGNMGRGMAASLARAGHDVVQYDRSAEALSSSVAQSRSITAAPSLAAMCVCASTIVVSVAGEAAERAVFLSEEGLMAHAPPGSLLIGCGTVTVSFARELHEVARTRSLLFLDAPVSGGPEGAANGTLTIMAGGKVATFDAAADALSGMGGLSKRMGSDGAGAAAKLINQLLTACNAHAASEALALARALGIDSPAQVDEMLSLLGKAWGNSTMLQRSGRIVSAALGEADPEAALRATAAAPLRNFAKDLDFVLQAAHGVGLQLPASSAARTAVRRAEGHAHDTADWAYVSEMHAAPWAALPPAALPSTPAGALSRPFERLDELRASVPPPRTDVTELRSETGRTRTHAATTPAHLSRPRKLSPR